ncbi:MAG TPA: DNA polymerase III subunit [Polyangiaceae bacterium]|nr:DNA polymerase III subunit [Polyangiaceae bacterium]
MSFDEIWGQDPAIQTLKRALTTGRVHHAYRFEGPPGVGKEMAAWRFARALVCERGGLGCGECSACRRAMTLSENEPHVPIHPDVVLLARGLYRSVTGQAEAAGIGVEQVRRIVLERVGYSPHEGRALVFIVRDADELTQQAANSLLKTLEEPPARTHFVLVTSRPNRLLDTIRSRAQPLRFSPLPEAVIARILEKNGRDPKLAPFAQGSAELALALADPEALSEREAFVSALQQALDAKDLAMAIKFAEAQKGDRDSLKAELAFFAQKLAASARESVQNDPAAAARSARRYAAVVAAMTDIESNVQAALVLETLIQTLRRAS